MSEFQAVKVSEVALRQTEGAGIQVVVANQERSTRLNLGYFLDSSNTGCLSKRNPEHEQSPVPLDDRLPPQS
jgi:hypothetical protein